LKKIAEKLDPERDADKKRLLEITDRQFEVNILIVYRLLTHRLCHTQ